MSSPCRDSVTSWLILVRNSRNEALEIHAPRHAQMQARFDLLATLPMRKDIKFRLFTERIA
jgi:hypothetical protein